MTDRIDYREFPPRWLMFLCVLAIAAGVGFLGFNQWAATQDRNTAQSNAATLAQDIKRICTDQGSLLLDDRDVCVKGESVLQNPTESIPGPKGDTGPAGKDGADGVGTPGADGPPGKDSTVPGPAGTDGDPGADSTIPGPPGRDGIDGKDGADGAPGADSTVPGPAGPKGEDGNDGQPPSSFTFTDKTGATYTCTPNPPGSSTFTCTSDGGLIP